MPDPRTFIMPFLVCEERRKDMIGGIPVLISVGNPSRCNRPTRHKYEHSEIVLDQTPNNKGDHVQAHIYSCMECGTQRIWGLEDTTKTDF
jgi:hypothetical protein